jgi:hypothetical protein
METKKPTPKRLSIWHIGLGFWQSILAGALGLTIVLLFPLQYIWNSPVSETVSHCKFTQWMTSTSKWNAGDAIISCLMDDGRLILLNQSAGWLPPTIGSEMKIGVIAKRFFGEDYYLK